MILKIALKIAINAAALYVASELVDGFSIERDISVLVFAGLLLWFGNAIIRPIIKLLTFPLILLTFGLFNVVINIFILVGVDILIPQMEISGIIPLLLTSLAISLISSLFFFL